MPLPKALPKAALAHLAQWIRQETELKVHTKTNLKK